MKNARTALWTAGAAGSALLGLLLAVPAAALDVGLSGLNTARYGWGTVYDTGQQALDRIYRENILDLDLSWKTLRLNLAGAALHAAELPDARAEDARIRDTDLVRRSLEWNGPLTVRLGHSWTTFGNGLALSLYRDDDLENPRLTGTDRREMPTTWDSGIDGVFVEGHWESFSLKALWGNEDLGPFEDSHYYGTLAGANLEWHHGRGLLGGSWVRSDGAPVSIQDADPDLLEIDSREVYGHLQLGSVELTLNHLDQHRRDNLWLVFPARAGRGGTATYGALALPLGEWFLQAEYKYYRFALRSLYQHNPPILQREIPTRLIARHRRLNVLDDEVGLQLEASRWFSGGQELRLQAAWASHIDDGLLPSLEEGLSAYQEYTAGWTQALGGHRHLGLGLAWAEETAGWVEGGRPRSTAEWTRKLGLSGTLQTPAPLLRSVELAGEVLRVHELQADRRSLAALFWADAAPWDGVAINLTADYEEESGVGPDWMASGELRWDPPAGRLMRHTLTLFAGRLRGGLVCSSGNCRIVAPFDGLKLTLTTRF
jgi:hypothetical protein